MALSVTVAQVKEKAGIAVATYDTAITNLINTWLPVLEHAIREEALNDASTGVQATLNLGACEAVTGEFQAQLLRTPGSSDTFSFGWLEVGPNWASLDDPYGLKAQGLARLAPFLKSDARLGQTFGVSAGGSRKGDGA
jgi:hypothetical protein